MQLSKVSGFPTSDMSTSLIVCGTYWSCNKFDCLGGTSYPITVTKSLRAQQIAAENGLPCVYIVDSGGAFLPLQSEIFPDAKHGGRSFANQAVMSANGVPQVSLVAGMCTAGGAYTPTMADEHIMVHKIANVYLGGPPLVKAALGESISGEGMRSLIQFHAFYN